MSGFGAGDVTVANGIADNLRGSGSQYTVAITPDGTGALEIGIAAGVATDAAGNGNTAAPSVDVAYGATAPSVATGATGAAGAAGEGNTAAPSVDGAHDADAPSVAIAGAPAVVNSQTPFDVTVTFSEEVSGFDAGDVAVINGAAGNLRGSGAVYTVAITPDGAGDLEIGVAADVAADAAGNGNTAAAAVAVAYDAAAPDVAIADAPNVVNSTAPFDVKVTFTEAVSGFDAGDVTVANGNAGNLRGSGAAYTVAITPDGAGDIEIGIAADVAADAAGNGNTAAPSVSVAYDAVAPDVEISGAPATVDSQTPFDVTVTFTEAVSGFGAGDVTVVNGAAGAPVEGSDASIYTVAITPDGAGDLEIGIAADVATDAAGNGNTAADPVDVAYIPKGSVTLVVNSPDAGTVRFTSQTPSLDNVAVAVSGGTGTSGALDVTAGEHVVTYVLPVGFSMTTASCLSDGDASGSVDRRTRHMSLDVRPGAAVTCTLGIQDTATRTARQVRDFMEERARLLMSHRSDRNRRLARLKGEASGGGLSIEGHRMPGGLPVPLDVEVKAGSKGSEKTRIRWSCTQRQAARGVAVKPSACKSDLWGEGVFGRYKTGDAKGHYGVVHAGIDRLVGRDMLVGVGTQYDRVVRKGKSDKQVADVEGHGWMAGPYVTARLNENLYFDGGIRAGTSSNRITMPGAGFSDTFSSWRWGAHATLLGDFDAGRFNIRPSVGFAWFEETAKAWKDGGGVSIPKVTTRKGDLEAGMRVSHTMPDGQSSQYVEVEGVFAVAGSGGKGDRLRVGTGATVALPFGGVLDAGVLFEGLGGGNWEAYAVKLGYSVSPEWLPGTIDAGFSFDGLGTEEWDAGALSLSFRSVPDTWFGGVFTTGLALKDADEAPLSGMSGKIGYELKF